MLDHSEPGPKAESVYTLMAAVGFLLSETHLLLYRYGEPLKAPVFFTSILILCTSMPIQQPFSWFILW